MIIATYATTAIKSSVVSYSSASREIIIYDKAAGISMDFYLANSSYWCKLLNVAAGTLACTACNSTYALQPASYCLKTGHTAEIGEVITPVFYNPNNSVTIINNASVLNTSYLNTASPAMSTTNQTTVVTKPEPKNYADVFNTTTA